MLLEQEGETVAEWGRVLWECDVTGMQHKTCPNKRDVNGYMQQVASKMTVVLVTPTGCNILSTYFTKLLHSIKLISSYRNEKVELHCAVIMGIKVKELRYENIMYELTR